MKNIYTTTLRLNLDKAADREAWEHLQRLDRTEYRSANSAIVAAINGWFERQEQLADNPYLETREKEDAFLQRVMEAVAKGLQNAPVGTLSFPQTTAIPMSADEDLSAALDFADSF